MKIKYQNEVTKKREVIGYVIAICVILPLPLGIFGIFSKLFHPLYGFIPYIFVFIYIVSNYIIGNYEGYFYFDKEIKRTDLKDNLFQVYQPNKMVFKLFHYEGRPTNSIKIYFDFGNGNLLEFHHEGKKYKFLFFLESLYQIEQLKNYVATHPELDITLIDKIEYND